MPRRTAHPDASFSFAFSATKSRADDRFDARLHTDTDLFVDPFLMFDEVAAPWADVHDRLIDFFNTALEHVARAGRNRESAEWGRAAAMLSFPEPPEFCLGYGERTIFGSGSGRRLGEGMLNAAQRAIDAGIVNIGEFGELLLFGENFGADRISDMVCNIVKDDFVTYTEQIAARHHVPTTRVRLPHVGYDFSRHRWTRRYADLPINPCWTDRVPVLLVPERVLAELPKMDDRAFWDWVYSNENEQLRRDLGYEVTLGLKKNEIIDLAKSSMRLRRKYGVRYSRAVEAEPAQSYDFARDPKLKIVAFDTAQAAKQLFSLQVPNTDDDLCSFVRDLIEKYRHSVEDSSLWKSLWENGAHRPESDAQRIFWAIVMHLCPEYDVDVTPEADEGVGPVDFKFSRGGTKKALAEFKLADNSHFWNNLETQLPAYLKAAAISCGYFVVVQFEDKHCTSTFVNKVKRIVARVSEEAGLNYESVFIDARKRPSASKLKRKAGAKKAAAGKESAKRATNKKAADKKIPPRR